MTQLFQSVLGGTFTPKTFFLTLLCALLCGVLCAIAASFREEKSKSFLTSLVILPMIVCTVILMVNGNVGTGVAVMGAFSLVRFRSVAGRAKDIAAIFLSMTAGLACAAGFIAYALVFTLIVCAVLLLLSFLSFGQEKAMDLRITVPESLSYATAFDDLFDRYTRFHRLVKVKTTSMGSLYKLQYRVLLKNHGEEKAFLDDLRCRNGNLEIALSHSAEGSEML